MPRIALTRELYDAMVKAYRERPEHHTHASQASGSTREFCKKTWNEGWKGKSTPWALPIKEVLEEEKAVLRADRYKKELEAEAQERDRQVQARVDAIQARGEEAKGAKASRTNALNFALAAGKMAVSAVHAATEIDKKVQAMQAGTASMSLDELRGIMNTASLMVLRAEQAMRLALEIERIVVGEPIATVGVKMQGMSPMQVVKELEGVIRTLGNAGAVADTSMPTPGGQRRDN